MSLSRLFFDNGGVLSTSQMAGYYCIPVSIIRIWAGDNGVPLVGNAFAFSEEMAAAFAADVLDAEEDECEADDESDEEGDAFDQDVDWQEDADDDEGDDEGDW
jgi:hypothetical protein